MKVLAFAILTNKTQNIYMANYLKELIKRDVKKDTHRIRIVSQRCARNFLSGGQNQQYLNNNYTNIYISITTKTHTC
jgi:hypothetical protein